MRVPDRPRGIAPEGWSRWLVPPAALAIHLAIGQAYAWSVFKPPLESALGLSGTASALPFQLAIVMLGLSAAFGGTLVERRGPRWAMAVSTICFAAGFLVSAMGAATGHFWLIVAGYGVLGGIGLGIGYISPVSTLLKWFPDRPGMATGIAIMGFGGGALIASPWSTRLLADLGSDASGIARTFLVMGLAYGVFMTPGVLLVRVPPASARPPAGPAGEVAASGPRLALPGVSARNALRTPQFWCLWVVLCTNVTAGIGILEKAAPMVVGFFAHTAAPVGASAAAGFVGLLSLANMLGRIVWSSVSDAVGRKNVYRLYLGAGALLYLVIALAGDASKPLFIGCAAVILSFYGGGFATIPAYLRDLFGTYQVGAIHGRLLTAWSTAGVLGPLIVNAVADARKSAGHSGPELYSTSFFIMIGLLVVGFTANELIRPVHPRHHEPPAPAGPPRAAAADAKGADR
ncbi:OFA family MFS transporter [Streptomyces noursei]|uniref:OFA family MFS transporter n=1 Tax=Streptomyces noursei TaxID=1971 RepID=UPI0016791EC2|nr:OFA family MFS transporter [Streptomyces noursei]MCZ1014900.1 OFA family MFS transporter [Streptomyces noursei]GGX49785.1 MFS transporter [Streptomyces noursei]